MNGKKWLKIIGLISLIGLVLTGCGQHHTSHPRAVTHHRSSIQRKQPRQTSDHQIRHHQPTVEKSPRPRTRTRNEINLGHGIIGHEDRGAGQIYVKFNMGRWTVLVQGNDVNQSSHAAALKAKAIADWAQNHTLPIPKTRGTLRVTTSGDLAVLNWDSASGRHQLHGRLPRVLQRAIHK